MSTEYHRLGAFDPLDMGPFSGKHDNTAKSDSHDEVENVKFIPEITATTYVSLLLYHLMQGMC